MTKKIRLWKLGNAEAGIAPSEDIIKKFTEILKEINKNGCTDIVWGPDINCEVIDIGEEEINVLEVNQDG